MRLNGGEIKLAEVAQLSHRQLSTTADRALFSLQLRAVLREHIGNMTTRIGNNAYCWDVVNEAVTNAGQSG